MARLLLGVSGSVAAYKAVELVRLASKAGHAVRVVQTASSQRFVGAATFAGITGSPVLVDEWERDPARGAFPDQTPPSHDPLSHLELVANADAFLVAPASAHTIAKLAHGLADNLLTSAALAARCPVLVAPAMNDAMFEHPATQGNLDVLRARGVHVIDPGTGALGSPGEWGIGRLAEPADLLATVESVLGSDPRTATPGPWAGLRVLVTAGGTREPIDSVRYVGNRSSGRMGLALAGAAAARGADVTVVAANVVLDRDPRLRCLDVATAAEMLEACERVFPDTDVLLMAAAVADFRPANSAPDKIKKDGRRDLTVEMEPTTDILARLSSRRRPGQTLVGFAAEHGDGAVALGRGKLERKGLDAVVVNDISRSDIGFDTAANEVTIVTATAEEPVPRASKDDIASAILATVDRLRGGARDAPRLPAAR